MPSLGIASHPGGCTDHGTKPVQGATPVTGVFPADGCLRRLEIGIQAIQLSPYHAGPATHRLQRLSTIVAFLACSCPRHLSDQGKAIRPRNVPPSSSHLRWGYDQAPRGALPAQQRRGRDQEDRPPLAGQQFRQAGQQHPIGRCVSRTCYLAVQYRQLVAKQHGSTLRLLPALRRCCQRRPKLALAQIP
jgi:hypothetical protein